MNIEFKYETLTTYQETEYYAEVDINISNVVVVKPDHTTWDSAEDYYGTKEMEWEVLGVRLIDEDGGAINLTEAELDYDKIEAWLWEQLEAMGDDNEY